MSVCIALSSLLSFIACNSSGTQSAPQITASYTLPDTPLAAFQNASLKNSIARDRKLLLGGIGSDLWHASDEPSDQFWMVSDRGPNGKVEVQGATRRTFPVPEFAPTIVHVRCAAGAIQILKSIPILTSSGKATSGLPNVAGHDETPYGFDGTTQLAFDANGLDVEALVRTKAGEFWLVEEYAPSLVHLDAGGRVLQRFVPQGLKLDGADEHVVDALPAICSKRKENRGFEGLAISGDEKTVFLALQSPLSNPNKKTGESSRAVRFIAFDVASSKPIAEWVYRMDDAKEFDSRSESQDDMKISALAWRSTTSLLVLERTDKAAKIYSVDPTRAKSVLGGSYDDARTAPSLEALADDALQQLGALPKELVIDLSKFKEVPDKIEGLAIVDAHTLAIANDNDFDVGKFDAQGDNVGKGAKSKLLVIDLGRELH